MNRLLPFDYCRCHNEACPKKEGCLRWLQRNSGRVHCKNMSEGQTEGCKHHIPKVIQAEIMQA